MNRILESYVLNPNTIKFMTNTFKIYKLEKS